MGEMVTVVNSGGTPSVIFNRAGMSIVTVTPGAIHSSDTPTSTTAVGIPRVSGHTIAIVPTSGNPNDPTSPLQFTVKLPADAEIGDLVEVWPDVLNPQAPAALVFPNVGERIGNGAIDDGTLETAAGAPGFQLTRFTKLTTTTWTL